MFIARSCVWQILYVYSHSVTGKTMSTVSRWNPSALLYVRIECVIVSLFLISRISIKYDFHNYLTVSDSPVESICRDMVYLFLQIRSRMGSYINETPFIVVLRRGVQRLFFSLLLKKVYVKFRIYFYSNIQHNVQMNLFNTIRVR